MKTPIKLLLLVPMMALPISCAEFLDAKPNKRIVIPSTAGDINALLNTSSWLNISPMVPFAAADDYTTTDNNLMTLDEAAQNAYSWNPELYSLDANPLSYSIPMGQVFYANVITDLLRDLENIDQASRMQFLGEAHFFRARAYFELAKVFLPMPGTPVAKNYTLPLKLQSDVNEIPEYLDTDQIYGFIESEIAKALMLLPQTNQYLTRPSVFAAHALMARVALVTGKYQIAEEHAILAVAGSSRLLDFNQIDASPTYPFPLFNAETIFFSTVSSNFNLTSSDESYVGPELFGSYQDDDLRKTLFFRPGAGGQPVFRGTYTGNFEIFDGMATGEMYLIAAEAMVRLGKVGEGLAMLNTLLEKRYRSGTFTPFDGLGMPEALSLVLSERRKELVFRNQRWADLKRLNLDPLTATTISRTVSGETITLPPNSPQYVFNIPARERAFEGR